MPKKLSFVRVNSWKFHAHFKASCLSFVQGMMLQFILISLWNLNSLHFHTLNRWLGKPRNIFVLWPVPKEKLVCLFLLFFPLSSTKAFYTLEYVEKHEYNVQSCASQILYYIKLTNNIKTILSNSLKLNGQSIGTLFLDEYEPEGSCKNFSCLKF